MCIPSSSRGTHGSAVGEAVGGCSDDRVSRDVGSGGGMGGSGRGGHPSWEEEEKEEEEEKDEEGMFLQLLFMTSLTILSSVLWVVSTAPCIWQSLVLFVVA